jgi:hypothetical protein
MSNFVVVFYTKFHGAALDSGPSAVGVPDAGSLCTRVCVCVCARACVQCTASLSPCLSFVHLMDKPSFHAEPPCTLFCSTMQLRC